jgi:predicted esterase
MATQTSASTPAITAGTWITQTINGMQYDVLLPANYNASIKYPTVLYLHQLDMGNDPTDLLATVNTWFNTAAFRAAHPAIIVMPLLDQSSDWSGETINWGGLTTADSTGETNALAALKQVMAQYSADPSRVYVTGNSMGGIGTEDMLIKYNAYTGTEGRIFAAGLSMAGADYAQGYPTPNASVVAAMKSVPFWAIHGGQDTSVPLAFDQNLYAAEQAGGGIMKYTQDNSLGHDVWDTYYAQTGASSPLSWLFSQSTGGTTTPATQTAVTPSANDTTVMAGSAAAITDAAGNKWTITSGKQVAVNGTADTTTSNVAELAYVNGKIWEENAAKLWQGKSSPSAAWSTASSTSPLPAATTLSPTTSSTVTASTQAVVSAAATTTTAGTRDASQIPFASNSVFNLPLGSGAQWTYNAQLASSNLFINTAGNYNENIWTGTASDPVVTITNTGGAGSTPGTFQVHIPAGAIAAAGGDQTFAVDDTVSHIWYSFGGFNWTGTNTATVSQGSGESDYGSGIQVDGSDWDEGVGTLRESDLQAGAINHMLRIELPTDMLESYSSNSNILAPNAWPQTAEDGFGPSEYTGTVPYGVTLGIAASAIEPAAVKANAGANMLWHELQDHGAMIRDSGGSGNTVIFQTDQDVDFNDPLIQGMIQYGAQIMAQVQILANQGPNSINGGGTPIVPLDPNPSDMPSSGGTTTGGTTTGGTTTGGTTTGGSTTTTTPELTTTSGGSLKDSAGNVWTLTSGGSVTENGTAIPGGGGTKAFAIVNNLYYGQDASSGLWYTYSTTGQSWASASAPALTSTTGGSTTGGSTTGGSTTGTTATTTPTPTATASTSIVELTTTSGGSLKDAGGNVWTLPSSGSVTENGTPIPGGGGTKAFAVVNEVYYGQDASSGQWYTYSPSGQSWASSAAPTLISPTTSKLALTASQTNVTVSQNQVSVVATAGTRMLFIKGTGDTVSVSGATNTIADTGSGNTYVLPAAGKGTDVFTTNVLANKDWLDLRTALAGTTWSGSASTLSNYVHVTDSAQGATLAVSASGSGSGTIIATIQGATTANLATVLAHALT